MQRFEKYFHFRVTKVLYLDVTQSGHIVRSLNLDVLLLIYQDKNPLLRVMQECLLPPIFCSVRRHKHLCLRSHEAAGNLSGPLSLLQQSAKETCNDAKDPGGFLPWGRYLNDVRTWRGGGTQKADKSTDEMCECDSDKGGGGSKNLEIVWTSFKYGPIEEQFLELRCEKC